MQLYKKILVPIDCSPVDAAIIEHVALLALQNSAKVYLLHVVHSHTLDQDRTLRAKAEAALKIHCQTLQQQGIEAFIVLKSGEPEEVILKEIDGQDYDLVAMATHGHTFLADLLFGSVSRSLKHKLSIPLLLLRPPNRP
ncbi:MAG: universal stress protein [Kiritimatiellales bacterium]|nr:universal stress protein [Kiritimatiellales bacterium]